MKTSFFRLNELSPEKLLDILKLRQDVFIVEQECFYPDIDDTDRSAVHAVLEEDGQILACLRIFRRAGEENTAQIGRVVSAVRRKGYGTEILKDALEYAKNNMYCSEAYLEAQCYAAGLYEKQGFHIVSEPFLEDGIPHVRMRRHL